MPTSSSLLFLLTESGLHAGAGAVLSHVDLPIQREVHTGHPIIYASGVKGGLRERCRSTLAPGEEAKLTAFFGPESDKASDHSGLAIFQEARVVLFPVRSFRGVFAWVTCPFVLRRLMRDLQATVGTTPVVTALEPGDTPYFVDSEKAIFRTDSNLQESGAVELEDFCFRALEGRGDAAKRYGEWFSLYGVQQIAGTNWWREKLKKDIVVVTDDVFTHFARHHTEIQTHVKIDSATGTVDARSGPRNEEALPPDTLLYSAIHIPRPQPGVFAGAEDAREYIAGKLTSSFQLCGDRTLGRGIVSPTLVWEGTTVVSATGVVGQGVAK